MLLFLDVDGTLLPFGGDEPYPEYEACFPLPDVVAEHPLLSRLDPTLGSRLDSLGCDLIWATTWAAADANGTLAPWLGLPPLQVVDWPDEDDPPGPQHWKTRHVVAWAAGQPFIWVDDEITEADHAWVKDHHADRALLHRVDHRQGLTVADLAALAAWLDGNDGGNHRGSPEALMNDQAWRERPYRVSLGQELTGRVRRVDRWGLLLDLGLGVNGFMDRLYLGDDLDRYVPGAEIQVIVVQFAEHNRQIRVRPAA